MPTSRVEAFSDGVLAIIITIMVLELEVPKEPTLVALRHSAPGFLTYLLSFVFVGIYWNNHHHMFHVATHVSGTALWANLHLLFWLSLYPFTTAWLDNTYSHVHSSLGRTPVVIYGINLLMAGFAYYLLQLALYRAPNGERLRTALGNDLKSRVSIVLYLLGIGLAFVDTWLSVVCYVAVALIWLVPDRRVERYVATHGLDEGRV